MRALRGDLYQRYYEGLYCAGCGSFLGSSDDLVDGCCPEHHQAPERVAERTRRH